MDRNLANYLFHNETLYAFKEEGLSEVEGKKQEVESRKPGIEKAKGEAANVNSPVNLQTQSSSSEPSDSVKKETNSAISEDQPAIYPMKTKHLIVVKNLQAGEKELLVKIMTAIKLQMDIVDLVDVATYPTIDFKETIYGNKPKAILFFGPESGEEFLVRLKLEKYSPKVLKGINFLLADNLGTILKDLNNEKRKLWNSLKEVFEV